MRCNLPEVRHTTTTIPISSIILDEDIYPRKSIDPRRIGIFAENIRDGFKFDPIEVEPAPGKPGMYRLLDGAHRWNAYNKNPVLTSSCKIVLISVACIYVIGLYITGHANLMIPIFQNPCDQEGAHTSMHLPAPCRNLAAIADKISSVISRIMIAEKITAFITTRKPAFS